MTNDPSPPSGLSPAAIAALWKGQMIEAIKVVRQEQTLGLKEAKDAVEAYLKTQPELKKKMAMAQAEQTKGCVRWLVVGVILLALAAYWFRTRGA
ncbi:MAG: ribosomal protein L7/L12 [Nitrospirota bacterium]|nr:ribosomal protein L7/L12 [Nitrospirota bacterium]